MVQATVGARTSTRTIVLDRPLDTATVWKDFDATDPSERYKLAIVPTNGTSAELPPGHGHYALYSSADGIHFVLRVKQTGVTEDGDSIWYNPFRQKFIFSVKAPSYFDPVLKGYTLGPFDRHRLYRETNAFFGEGAHWRQSDLATWIAADELDPPWLGSAAHSRKHDSGTLPGLYLFDATAYESVLVSMMPIFRCKAGYQGCPQHHPEFNSIFVGFSRDGFFFSRPPAGTPGDGVRLDSAHRTPFMPLDTSQRPSSWNYGCLLTAGGPAIVNDTLYFFGSGSTGSSNPDERRGGVGPHNWTQSTGLALLRRDGFAAMTAATIDEGGSAVATLKTRLLRFSGRHLFVNVEAMEPTARLLVHTS